MNKPIFTITFFCFITLILSACQDEDLPTQTEEQLLNQDGYAPNFVHCPENRPDVCTQIYQPVCGLVDTGIRCITTPCPSVEEKNFGNACTACIDKKVSGYVEGECEINEDNQHSSAD